MGGRHKKDMITCWFYGLLIYYQILCTIDVEANFEWWVWHLPIAEEDPVSLSGGCVDADADTDVDTDADSADADLDGTSP